MNEHSDGTSLEDRKYQNPDLRKVDMPQAPSSKDEKEMHKVREELESFNKWALAKYKFITGIGIIPPQAAGLFDDENELTEVEKKEKPMHLLVVLPDDKEKEFNAIKVELIKKLKESKLPEGSAMTQLTNPL